MVLVVEGSPNPFAQHLEIMALEVLVDIVTGDLSADGNSNLTVRRGCGRCTGPDGAGSGPNNV